ncbi:BglG family transcription antiterminator [Enterococcus crotali]|uniref:BglG family transcription antiterminator n=1 Tax=Enterococcus crotali TaxID=1453587 RepID=UPI0004722EBC|nr:PTS sugar transporter subunit IIA [Enterococcus crotali]
MNKLSEEQLIKYLQINGLTSSSQLAQVFSVSTRTIKNYVKRINEHSTEKIIHATSKGYYIAQSETPDIFSKEISREKVLTEKLIYLLTPINKYDLAEELFISLSTLERTITKANAELNKFHLKIVNQENAIQLVGPEEKKRAWIREQFYHETSAEFLHRATIQAAFYGYDLEELKATITQILKENNLYINGYTLNSIILHIVVAMERIYDSNQSITNDSAEIDERLAAEHRSAIAIAAYIQHTYAIQLKESEISYMTILLKSKTTLLNYAEIKEDLKDYIADESIQLSNRILQKINEEFLLSLDDEDFFIKFSLHLQNLLSRNREKQVALNPMTKEIKENYPLVYDLAVFVSNELEEYLGSKIAEDEITYLAFHIGAYFEHAKINQSKLFATLICPSYYDMHIDLSEKILAAFDYELDIKKVITEVDAPISNLNQELIISTIVLPSNVDYVKITPFFNEKDKEIITKAIKKLNLEQQQLKMKKVIEQYFSKELFEKNQRSETKYQLIHHMSNHLADLNRVNSSFEEEILRREDMSSTSFGNGLAMPHSMEMNALKTSLYFVINEEPMLWDQEYVQIVVMIAMNRSERKEFRKIFNLVIESLDNKETIAALLKADSYEEFVSCLVDSFRF